METGRMIVPVDGGGNELAPVSPDIRRDIVGLSGQPETLVDAVLAGFGYPVRNNDKKADEALLMQLLIVARSYGATQEIPGPVIEEAGKFVKEQFGFLAVNEIPVAFRLFASGTENVQGAEMYRGEFSVAALGKVLRAYANNRAAVVAAIYRKDHELKVQRQEKERQERLMAAYEENFIVGINTFSGEWSDVPFEWYDTCLRKGLLEFDPGEKRAIWAEAQTLAKLQLMGEVDRLREDRSLAARSALQSAMDQILDNGGGVAIKIAKQLSVYRKVIIPMRDGKKA